MNAVYVTPRPPVHEAVQLTAENREEVVAWCHGRIVISVEGWHLEGIGADPERTHARAGDWIVKGGWFDFKRYSDNEFRRHFIVTTDAEETA